MKELLTRVGTYATTDVVADAVMKYALALARAHRLDVVDIPFLADDGKARLVQLRIGWMVDIDAVGAVSGVEGSEEAVTDDLRRRERALVVHGDEPLTDELLGMDGFSDF
jgi:hypothetical protein